MIVGPDSKVLPEAFERVGHVGPTAEVGRQRQLLEADHLCSVFSGDGDPVVEGRAQARRVGAPRTLHRADPQTSSGCHIWRPHGRWEWFGDSDDLEAL